MGRMGVIMHQLGLLEAGYLRIQGEMTQAA